MPAVLLQRLQSLLPRLPAAHAQHCTVFMQPSCMLYLTHPRCPESHMQLVNTHATSPPTTTHFQCSVHPSPCALLNVPRVPPCHQSASLLPAPPWPSPPYTNLSSSLRPMLVNHRSVQASRGRHRAGARLRCTRSSRRDRQQARAGAAPPPAAVQHAGGEGGHRPAARGRAAHRQRAHHGRPAAALCAAAAVCATAGGAGRLTRLQRSALVVPGRLFWLVSGRLGAERSLAPQQSQCLAAEPSLAWPRFYQLFRASALRLSPA